MKSRATEAGRFVTHDGAELYYELRGAGSPVVLVAGVGDDIASWDTVEPLADDHVLVAFDNRGVRRSSTPPGPYSIEAMADDADALVGHLDLGPVAAVGSSMGGAICQRWALRHPDDIARLVLTNTWGAPDPRLDTLLAHWGSLAERGDGRNLMASIALSCLSPGFIAAEPKALEELLTMEPPRLDGFVAAAAACRAHDALADAGAISQPALVIAGEQDTVTPPKLSVQLANQLPNADLVSLDAGHSSFVERPGEWLEIVGRFIKRAFTRRSVRPAPPRPAGPVGP